MSCLSTRSNRQGVEKAGLSVRSFRGNVDHTLFSRQKRSQRLWRVAAASLFTTRYSFEYHLFRSMQHALYDTQFQLVNKIQKWLDVWISSKDAAFCCDEIHHLPGRWLKVIENNGEHLLIEQPAALLSRQISSFGKRFASFICTPVFNAVPRSFLWTQPKIVHRSIIHWMCPIHSTKSFECIFVVGKNYRNYRMAGIRN